MPAFVRHDRELAVTFHRDGRMPERHIVEDGRAAIMIALRILAGLDQLQPGDRIDVEADGGAPPVSFSSQHST